MKGQASFEYFIRREIGMRFHLKRFVGATARQSYIIENGASFPVIHDDR